MNKDKLIEILHNQKEDYEGDKIFNGLKILFKYSKDGIVVKRTYNDVIYSLSIQDCLDSNISEKELIRLGKMGWMIDEEDLEFYVWI